MLFTMQGVAFYNLATAVALVVQRANGKLVE